MPPTDPSLFEYEPIQQFFADPNYLLNTNNNNNNALPTRSLRKVRRINMLKAKLNSNVSQMPMSIASALRHPNAADCMAAFASKIASLKDMHTFIPYTDDVKLIPKGSLLSSKAIFNIVYNPDGTFKKFKACLVARGDQLKSIYDPDTYTGTVGSPTIRLLLALAAHDDLDLVSHDIKSAFLYSFLKPEEKIYLKHPSGTTDDIMPPVVQLIKCLYGLPQASKYFDDHLSATLLSIGFTRCVADSEVFFLRRGGDKVN